MSEQERVEKAQAWLDNLCVEVLGESEPFNDRNAEVDAESFLRAVSAAAPVSDAKERLDEALSWIAQKAPRPREFDEASSEIVGTEWLREQAAEARALLSRSSVLSEGETDA